MLRWFFFCDTGIRTRLRTSPGEDPCDRRRLLCWAVLCTFVWAHLSHIWLNFVMFVVCTVCLSLLVNFLTNGDQNLTETVKGASHIALVIGLMSAVTTLTCQPVFLRYEFIVRKLALKEYALSEYWCPATYFTLFGITAMSCILKGIHVRLGLKLLPSMTRHHLLASPPSAVS